MKRIVIPLFFVLLVGCQQQSSDPGQVILNNRENVRTAAALVTSVSLLSVEDADRVETARTVYQIAITIKGAAATQTDLSGVDTIAQGYLDQWDSQYKIVVGTIISSVERVVANYTQSSAWGASEDVHLQALRTFLESAASGVADAALPLTQGKPKVVSVRASVRPGGIAIPNIVWERP